MSSGRLTAFKLAPERNRGKILGVETTEIKELTPFNEVNEIISTLNQEVQGIIGEELVGLYLTGSLTYGDFNPGRSDIDFLVVTQTGLSKEKMDEIKAMHERIGEINPKWAERIECSYIPADFLQNVLPPKTSRPYFGEGKFYPTAPYGNEWIINQYLLYKHGVALIGLDFEKLINPIDIKDVQKACIRDLFAEWEPKITDPDYLKNSHYQSYVALNLCRILYTVMCGDVASKTVSASWAKQEFPEWSGLIKTAENWEYGGEMNLREETIEFIKFVISHVVKKQYKN